jgi:D-glycero-D-manno-heptose 1,7-bisphosphate phosphatase
MVLDAAKIHNVDLTASYFIGDRTTDIETGRNAGCHTILVLTGAGAETQTQLSPDLKPDFIAKDLSEAASWITEKNSSNSDRAGGR